MREFPQVEEERRPPNTARRSKLLRLAAQGLNARRASEIMGLPYSAVLSEYRDVEFKRQCFELVEGAFGSVDAKVVEFQLSLHDRIRMKSEVAFDKLCELLEDDATLPQIKVKIAQDFLDRNPESQAGHTVTRSNGVAEAAQLQAAASAAREMDNVLPFPKTGTE